MDAVLVEASPQQGGKRKALSDVGRPQPVNFVQASAETAYLQPVDFVQALTRFCEQRVKFVLHAAQTKVHAAEAVVDQRRGDIIQEAKTSQEIFETYEKLPRPTTEDQRKNRSRLRSTCQKKAIELMDLAEKATTGLLEPAAAIKEAEIQLVRELDGVLNAIKSLVESVEELRVKAMGDIASQRMAVQPADATVDMIASACQTAFVNLDKIASEKGNEAANKRALFEDRLKALEEEAATYIDADISASQDPVYSEVIGRINAAKEHLNGIVAEEADQMRLIARVDAVKDGLSSVPRATVANPARGRSWANFWPSLFRPYGH